MVCLLPWGLPHGISIIWGSIGHDLWDGKENTMERAGIGPIYGGWFALVGISTSVPKNGYLPKHPPYNPIKSQCLQYLHDIHSLKLAIFLGVPHPDAMTPPSLAARHSHFPWDMTLADGVRYKSWPLGTPAEQARHRPWTNRRGKTRWFPQEIIYKWLMFRIYVSLS